jgi:uncharacterized MAPEG superfamily protein
MSAAGLLSYPVLAALSVGLLVVHVLIQAHLSNRERGSDWNAGPRDDTRPLRNPIAGRAERMSANFRETYPGFVALAFALHAVGDTSGWALGGALLWFAARIVYIPLYLGGVAYIRSAVWGLSLLGLLIMLVRVVMTAV